MVFYIFEVKVQNILKKLLFLIFHDVFLWNIKNRTQNIKSMLQKKPVNFF